MKLIKSVVINKIGHFKWIYIFGHVNPSVSLRFEEICLNFMSIRFPVLTITAAKLNFIWFHWNQSIVFWNPPWFQKPIRYFFWFQYGFIETILVSKRDFGPNMTKNEVSRAKKKHCGYIKKVIIFFFILGCIK